MISTHLLSRLYHFAQPAIELMSDKMQVRVASAGRKVFMQEFANQTIKDIFIPNDEHNITAWGIKFRSPLMNSAGMFKNGEAYDVVASLGAGGYIGGTSTANSRTGNLKNGIHLPFITFPKSKVAINWLGLPNLGDDLLSEKKLSNHKVDGCPIGWSLMRSPDMNEEEGVNRLIESLWKYHDNRQIDFIEINESCPNVRNGGGSILPRLEKISKEFLSKRTRSLPVVVKLSSDLTESSVQLIVDALVKLNFDGINLGNTSTDYVLRRNNLVPEEKELYDYFIKEFGGGVSGSVLKDSSLHQCSIAAEQLTKMKPQQEFHIIRSGGIDTLTDIEKSQQNGVTLNQWYTGFFNNYHLFGKDVYKEFFLDN